MPAKASRDSVRGLVDSLLEGDKRSAGKLISLIEDDEPEAVEAVTRIFPHTGRAHVVGLTGPPGVGKSSLINRLVRAFRSRGRTVGVVAVDPTSPYTGGAVLGDRIRMADTGVDPRVLIRSMATRGAALEGRGIDDLAGAIEKHASYLDQSGGRRKREVARARLEILENVQRLLVRRVSEGSRSGRAFQELAEDVAARRLDPHAAARKLLGSGSTAR